MNWWMIVGAIVVVLIIAAIFFRKYLSGLFYDYVVDCGLSFADYLLAGAGAIGIDVGDWIAAIIIFVKERKISSGPVAFIVAWEATNWLPLSLIPVVGEGIEIVFNFVPAVTISRIFFAKYGAVEKEERKLNSLIAMAHKFGIGVGDAKQILEKAKKLIAKEDLVDGLKAEAEADKALTKKLIGAVNGMIGESERIVSNVANLKIQAPAPILALLQNGINQADAALNAAHQAANSGNLEAALEAAQEAKVIIVRATQQFQTAFQDYNRRVAEIEMEG